MCNQSFCRRRDGIEVIQAVPYCTILEMLIQLARLVRQPCPHTEDPQMLPGFRFGEWDFEKRERNLQRIGCLHPVGETRFFMNIDYLKHPGSLDSPELLP